MVERVLLSVHSSKGFTFIELLVAVTVVAVLGLIAMVVFPRVLMQSRDAKRSSIMHDIQFALGLYNLRNQQYPDSSNSFCTVFNTLISGHYLEVVLVDPRTQTPICSSGEVENKTIGGAMYTYVATPSSGMATSYLLKLTKESGGSMDFFSP